MQIHLRTADDDTIVRAISASRWAPPDGSRSLDLTNLWALPGLADAHAHLSADTLALQPAHPGEVRRRLYACVQAGVFLCLDKGWCDDVVLRIATDRAGPRVEAAGSMISAPGGYYPDFAVEADESDLASAVAERVRAGSAWVKIVGDWPRRGGDASRFSQEALARATALAHAGGARVAVHTMAPGTPSAAVEAGVDSIEHGLHLTPPDLAVLAGRGGVWVPTILRMEEVLAEMRPGSTGSQVVGAGLENVERLLPLAAEMGVVVLAGSDLAVPSTRIGAESVALARRGLPVRQAIAAAGSGVWASIGGASGFAVGAPADLVAFDRDPRSDLDVLAEPTVVVHRGRVVRDRR
jgi:imidazolonepropionase-like amidohydrolase